MRARTFAAAEVLLVVSSSRARYSSSAAFSRAFGADRAVFISSSMALSGWPWLAINSARRMAGGTGSSEPDTAARRVSTSACRLPRSRNSAAAAS